MLRAANYANEMQRNLPWYEDHASALDRSDSSDDNSSCDGAKGKLDSLSKFLTPPRRPVAWQGSILLQGMRLPFEL